jgi:hypothetical protein
MPFFQKDKERLGRLIIDLSMKFSRFREERKTFERI